MRCPTEKRPNRSSILSLPISSGPPQRKSQLAWNGRVRLYVRIHTLSTGPGRPSGRTRCPHEDRLCISCNSQGTELPFFRRSKSAHFKFRRTLKGFLDKEKTRSASGTGVGWARAILFIRVGVGQVTLRVWHGFLTVACSVIEKHVRVSTVGGPWSGSQGNKDIMTRHNAAE
jgi:hypothetical protein